MRITVAFCLVVAVILASGIAYDRWDRSRRLRFGDEAGSTSSTWALARVESRELLHHPAWLITVALVTAVTVALIVLEGGAESEAASLPWFAFVGIPMAGLGLVVSAHRTTTRARRHGTDELIAATPTAARARTMAHLISCVAPLTIVALYVVLDLGLVYVLYELTPRPTAEVLVPVLAFVLPVVGGGVVGVFLGRWLPLAMAPLAGIVAILWLNNGVEHLHPRFRMLRAAVEEDYGGPFDIDHVGWHLIFVVSIIGLGACLALWRHGARQWLTVATVAVVAVMVSLGWLITRPPSAAEVADVVDRLEHPAENLSCTVRSAVTYCVQPGVEHWIDRWGPAVDEVLAQVPLVARPDGLRLVQRLVVNPRELLPEIQAALDGSVAWANDGDLHPNYSIGEEDPDLAVAWQAAAVAVGLPPATSWERPAGCMAGGQARTVLAHVLAARATTTTSRTFAEHAEWVTIEGREREPVPIDVELDYDTREAAPTGEVNEKRSDEWEPTTHNVAADGSSPRPHVAVVGASGWGSDVLAAEVIASADRSTVDAVIAAHWDELVDPATPTSRFLELTGPGPPSGSIAPITSGDDPRACP
ncbi:MAG TPA: hypothetical protein VJM33_04715 [Microthrixaceae bacterium]|nr:hypothetical protein [Microthrixaceae bacterium]